MRFEIHIFHHPDQATAERLERIESMLGQVLQREGNIMAAIDDLKTNIAALIAEATSDITTLVNNAASSSNDPAIQQLATDVASATADLHNKFTSATGAPVQPAPPSA